MKRKISKISVIMIIISFLFSNLGVSAKAENYKNATNEQVITEQTNDNENNLLNSDTTKFQTDSPLSDDIIEEIRQKSLLNNSRLSINDTYNSVSAAKLTESKISPVIILIKFKGQTDEEAYSSSMVNNIKDAFIGETNSLNGYLNRASYNRCSVDPYFAFDKGANNVYIYEAPYSKEYYDPAYTSDYFSNGQDLLKEAFIEIKKQIPSNVNLDVDCNGKIDAVDFFVPDQTAWATFLWPHMSLLFDSNGSTEVNGARLSKYNLITTKYFSGAKYRVITHEFMHTLGYPDMYVYGDGTLPDPIGSWTMMANNTGYPTVWERQKYGGWISQEQIPTISESGIYNLSDASKNPETNTIAYRIDVPNSDEFFMVEYRDKSADEYEALVPSTGIIVYRVNPKKAGNSTGDPEVYVLRKSGQGSYDAALNGQVNGERSIDLKLQSGEDTGYTVEYISNESGKASFKLIHRNEFEVTDFVADKQSPIGCSETVSLTANVKGNSGECTYSFGTIFNGKETYFTKDSSCNTCTFSPSSIFDSAGFNTDSIGTHTLFVEVKDSEGNVARKTIDNYEVKPLEILSLTTNVPSPQKVGTMINIAADTLFEASYRYNPRVFTVTKDGVSQTLNNFGYNSVNWTPNEPGIYTITYYVKDYLNQEATKSIQFEVTDAEDTQTTIYYKGYDNPYIHYKVGNGSWTNVPGVKMEQCDEVSGYPYKITLELGDSSNLTACFNNGNGQWDSNGGRNYTFESGYYTYCNGVITKINKPQKKLEIESLISKLGSSFVSGNENIITAKVKNASGEVQYKFDYVNHTTGKSGSLRPYHTSNAYAGYFGEVGDYTVTVTAKDSAGNIATKSIDFTVEEYKSLEIKSVVSSLGDKIKVGQETEFTINTTGGKGTNYYSLYVDGKYILNESSSNKVTWKPEKAGTYEIVAYAREAQGGNVSYKKTITVEEKSKNITTIYYKGYDNPYIHYKIGNGTWTNAPGIKMIPCTDVDGYNYKIEIELGNETFLTACFNNGNGQWDSNGGKNYTFNAGKYGYSNGVIVPINTDIKILDFYCYSDKYNFVDGMVEFRMAATSKNGNVYYTVTATKDGKTEEILSDTCEGTCLFIPKESGKYLLTLKVRDDKGNTATRTMDFTVPGNEENVITIYYKGYNNPYMHYKIGNGAWTNAPGVKMEATNEMAGYTHKITVDLKDADNLTACFNNGNGQWDSNNGANYYFSQAGTYTYCNGSINKIK